MVGRGYRLAVDFAHEHGSIAGPIVHVRGQNRPLNGNHIQPRPAHDQNIPDSPPRPSLHANSKLIIPQRGEPGYEANTSCSCI